MINVGWWYVSLSVVSVACSRLVCDWLCYCNIVCRNTARAGDEC